MADFNDQSSSTSKINFSDLHEELKKAIENDKRYWLENDAKFRAVNQHVSSYEEFRNIVKASHLKPIEHKNLLGNCKGCIWNTVSSHKTENFSAGEKQKVMDQQELKNNFVSDNSECNSVATDGFIKKFRSCTTVEERFQLLQSICSSDSQVLFKTEIPVGLLGEIIEVLSIFPPSTQNMVIVCRILEQLTQTQSLFQIQPKLRISQFC
ncbi:dynein axonemal assembly factor 19 isoform X2 [Lycorma delicatula]|uniref:dynein axonemal assembly factor 19 isoform X2 n=1 Tax=Lycorma delicatula TaxID=130591 RepID=UPI003F5184D9